MSSKASVREGTLAFWSGEKLNERLQVLVEGFDKSRIDCAAYTLRIGRDVYISPTGEIHDPPFRGKRHLLEGQGFVIPPGQFAFLLSEEAIRVPSDAIAFISIRAGIKLRGLINVSGFHVDPGYDGKLLFSVFNAGPSSVHLSQGEEAFLIWYADLDRESNQIRSKPGFRNGIPSNTISTISDDVLSMKRLDSRISKTESNLYSRMNEIEKTQSQIKTERAIVITLLLLLSISLIMNFLNGTFSSDNPTQIEATATSSGQTS
jgi:dCTP deaminase